MAGEAIMKTAAGAAPADINAELAARLEAFRRRHPERTLDHNGLRWRYLSSGEGDGAVVILPGAFGYAEIAFMLIEALETDRRVIAPSWPAARSLGAMTDGIEAILDAEGIARADVLGGSFGGTVAQSLVRAHPDRVDRLILSHTIAPAPDYAARMRRMVWIGRAVPMWLGRAVLRKRVAGLLPDDFAAKTFWNEFLGGFAESIPKATVVAVLECMCEFICTTNLAPSDLEGRGDRILIIESDNDPSIKEDERAAVRALHPGARVHTFHGTGHGSSVLEPEAYAEVVRGFLGGQPSSSADQLSCGGSVAGASVGACAGSGPGAGGAEPVEALASSAPTHCST